jgi:hypothetical protein
MRGPHLPGKDSPVAWYLALVFAGVAALLVSAAGSESKFPVVLATVLLGSAAIVASASIGFFLLPAVLAAGLAIVVDAPQRIQT